jgi:hypothetical protein
LIPSQIQGHQQGLAKEKKSNGMAGMPAKVDEPI